MSNLGYYMVNSSELDDGEYKQYHPGITIGYFREDFDDIQSGFGFQYILGVDPNYIKNSSSKKQNLYGFGVYSFVDRQVSFTRLGLRSYYDFGNSDYNFIMGLTIGMEFEALGVNFNINYFKGCLDFVNFARSVDYIEMSVRMPLNRRGS